MPTYTYKCDECGSVTEGFHAARKRLSLACEACGHAPMTWQFPCPSIQSNKTFLANRDDGFGNDDQSRRLAYAKARAAGVNPTGKVYCPSLCPVGEPLSPQAWITDKADARRVCIENGWSSETLGVKPAPIDAGPEPYRVADDLVEREVDRIVDEQGGDVTPSEREALTETMRERLVGSEGES